MRRPRKFLSLIIFLLVVNALFFSVWYPLGGRDFARNYLAGVLGSLTNSKIEIGDLHLSDKQILIQDFSFAASDSLIDLKVSSLRVRYNLYKLILSGFKPRNVVSSIEIIEPVATIRYHAKSDPEKKKKSRGEPFKIPDLAGYFKSISIEQGSVSADLAFEIKIINQAPLVIEESLSEIELRVLNGNETSLNLSAVSALGGVINVEGTLDKGRIASAKAEIEDLKPLYISHPDIRDFRTEININASYSEPADGSEPLIDGQAFIWNTTAYAIDRYRVRIPLIDLKTDGKDARLSISRSRIGESSLLAELIVKDIFGDFVFDGSSASFSLNASDIIPELNGLVDASIVASGTIKEPNAKLNARGYRFAYQDWALEDFDIQASYQDGEAKLQIPQSRWKNQALELSGNFVPKTMSFLAELKTNPINTKNQDLVAKGSLTVAGIILKTYPLISITLDDVDVSYRDLSLKGINGSGSLVPTEDALLASVDLESSEGYRVNAVGDVLSRHISADVEFSDFLPAGLYDQNVLSKLAPRVSGKISGIMTGNDIWYRGDLQTRLLGDFNYRGELDLLGNVNIMNPSVIATLNAKNSFFNDLPADFNLNMDYQKERIKISSFKLEDMLNLSGELTLNDLWDSKLDIALRNIDSARITKYYPDIAHFIPEFDTMNLFARYNQNRDQKINAWLHLKNIDLLSVIPLNLNLFLKGDMQELAVSGNIKNGNQTLLLLNGKSSLRPRINLALEARMNDLKMQEVLTYPPGKASISGTAGLSISDALAKNPDMEISADLNVKDMQFGDFQIDHARVKAAQLSRALVVDSLYVSAKDLFTATAKGSLDYNAVQNAFYEGSRSLEISAQGELFPWLKTLTSYIQESRGSSKVQLTLSTSDDQFMIKSGAIDLDQGYVHLKDQVEPMRDIRIQGVFENNRFMIQRGTFNMGNGSFYLSNLFDPEQTDHFMISFVDLGYFRVLIEEPGIQATIPVIAPPLTLTNVAIRGLDGRYATIRGPFDDMNIEALVTTSNLDILFPPGADNLLNLIMSVRGTGKKPDTDPVPLPFKLDLRVIIGENVRYVTYPTNLYLAPGGFLHIRYDGSRFIVEEANIVSDRGSIDFFGTVFQVDNIAITMIDQQNILSVNGQFYKRTPDGSTILLTVNSSPEYDKGFFDRLQINLSSDNPQDQSIAQVLSRLRYNQSMDELPNDQKQNLFQDEALGLIGGNLNSTVLTPFFYPFENWVRRTLKLDGFSINAGFIQNIFTEYSANPSQLADMTDLSNLSSDITQFSSSILLNNLSVSMSKYLGYRLFADYSLQLQEATDLQQKTKLLVSHDTSLRLVLPRQFRVGYTMNYSPKDTGLTHEIMLQKSWRFWGF